MSDPHTQTGTRNRVSLYRLVRRIWPKDPRRAAFAKRIRCARQKRDASTEPHDREYYQFHAKCVLGFAKIVCLPNK